MVSVEDFFTYACIRQYEQRNSIRSYDGSLAYAVEWVDVDAETLDRLNAAAAEFAATLPAPNYADAEHGLYAVAAACRGAFRRIGKEHHSR